jgi:hypothetical protein
MTALRSGRAVAARTFTPAEANEALSEVRPVAERIVQLRERMRELEGEQREIIQTIAGNGSGYAVSESRTPELQALVTQLEACVAELDVLGVQVKDLDLGLLDFPGIRRGEDVLLCWHVGEERVEWWHGLEEGYAGRKPIDWGEEEEP